MATSCCAATSSRFVASSSCRARKTRTLAMKNPPSIGLAHHYSSSAGAISSSSSSISSSISSTRGSILSAPVWATSPSTYSSTSPHRSSSVSLRKFSSDPVLRQRHRSLAAAASAAEPVFGKKSKSPASGALWLEYLRRHAAIITLEDVHAAQQQQSDQSQSTRKQLSAMVAFALCFLASASSSTTGSSSSTSSTTTTSSNQEAPKFTPGGDGGGGGGKLKSTKTKPMFLFSKLQAEKDVQQVQKDATENPYLVSMILIVHHTPPPGTIKISHGQIQVQVILLSLGGYPFCHLTQTISFFAQYYDPGIRGNLSRSQMDYGGYIQNRKRRPICGSI